MAQEAHEASFNPSLPLSAVMLALAIAGPLTLTLTQSVQAQSYNVIHNFTGGLDGGHPRAGLTMDQAGNLYGTAHGGGITGGICGDYGCGAVFKLAKKGSGWITVPLYNFAGGDDGSRPFMGVTIGADGSLYGTTYEGGEGKCSNCGTVFNLKPPPNRPPTPLSPWMETVLYRFMGEDGQQPEGSALIFDKTGNLYGTTSQGGTYGLGTVYELSPSNGSWTESVLWNFGPSTQDGTNPRGGVVFDKTGNLYGTTWDSFYQKPEGTGGIVFQLTPSGSGWTENIIYRFTRGLDGGAVWAGLIFDPSGNLYGGTTWEGAGGGGTVFEMTPSGDNWTFTPLYGLSGGTECGVYGDLVMDQAGNLYGTTLCDGAYGLGSVFKLTPSNGGWTYTSLHDFTGGSDGANASCNLVFDGAGNLYGTAVAGGTGSNCTGGCGVVFEITP
jgi:uncharacterized repeat protein (TIGR03803 family)